MNSFENQIGSSSSTIFLIIFYFILYSEQLNAVS